MCCAVSRSYEMSETRPFLKRVLNPYVLSCISRAVENPQARDNSVASTNTNTSTTYY